MAISASARILLNKVKVFAYGQASSAWDAFLWILNVPEAATAKIIQGDKKIIVYAGENLPPRIPRLAKWCKRKGNFATILICGKYGFHEKFSNPDIDYTFLFRNKWHLKRIIKGLPQVYIVHGFAPKSKYPYLASKAFKKRSPSTPFVADYQDVLAIYYGTNPKQRWLQQELPYEKLCLQNADGIVAHSLEPCEGMKVWGIKKSGKRIYFPLYADNDYFFEPKTPFSDNNIHMVYAGGVFGSHRDKRYYGTTQMHWLINYFTKQKIHFHIYPSPTVQKADYEEYEQIAKSNEYLHFHPAVPQHLLSKELSQYHYGLMPFFYGDSQQSDLKYKYATTLKLFNYVEAGIPILVSADVIYQSWLVEKYNLGISVNKKEDFADIRQMIGKTPYEEQVKKVLQNREKLSLGSHIPRLMKFYESLKAEK